MAKAPKNNQSQPAFPNVKYGSEQLYKALEHVQDLYPTAADVAVGAYLDPKSGEMKPADSHHCHAWVSRLPVGVELIVSVANRSPLEPGKDRAGLEPLAYPKRDWEKYRRDFLEWLVYSAQFQAVFHGNFYHRGVSGSRLFMGGVTVTNTRLPANLILNALILSRFPHERPNSLKLWFTLSRHMRPDVATLLVHQFWFTGANWDKLTYESPWLAHSSFEHNMSLEVAENFVANKHHAPSPQTLFDNPEAVRPCNIIWGRRAPTNEAQRQYGNRKEFTNDSPLYVDFLRKEYADFFNPDGSIDIDSLIEVGRGETTRLEPKPTQVTGVAAQAVVHDEMAVNVVAGPVPWPPGAVLPAGFNNIFVGGNPNGQG